MFVRKLLISAAVLGCAVVAQVQEDAEGTSGESAGSQLYKKDLSTSPGYVAKNHHQTRSGFYVDLSLAGEARNVFGQDLPDLRLEVEYETAERLHVIIKDSKNTVTRFRMRSFPAQVMVNGARPRMPNLSSTSRLSLSPSR